MDEKQDPPKNTWKHDAKVGFGPVVEAIQSTRDKVASSISEIQAEINRKKAVLARFGKG